jgi:hypothetical protein
MTKYELDNKLVDAMVKESLSEMKAQEVEDEAFNLGYAEARERHDAPISKETDNDTEPRV